MTLIKFLDRTGGFFVGIVTSFAVPILQIPFAYFLFWQQTRRLFPKLHWSLAILLTLTAGSVLAAFVGFLAFYVLPTWPLYGMMIGLRDGLKAAIMLPIHMFKNFEKTLMYLFLNKDWEWESDHNPFAWFAQYIILAIFPVVDVISALVEGSQYPKDLTFKYVTYKYREEMLSMRREDEVLESLQTTLNIAETIATRRADNPDAPLSDADNEALRQALIARSLVTDIQARHAAICLPIIADLLAEDPNYFETNENSTAILNSIAPSEDMEIISVLTENEAEQFKTTLSTLPDSKLPEYTTRKEIKENLEKYTKLTLCSISHMPIEKPVTVMIKDKKSGEERPQVYEHASLAQWIQGNSTNPTDPNTREPLVAGPKIHGGYPNPAFIRTFTSFARKLMQDNPAELEEKQHPPAQRSAASRQPELKRSASASTLPSQAQLTQAGITLFPTAKRSRSLSRTRSQPTEGLHSDRSRAQSPIRRGNAGGGNF